MTLPIQTLGDLWGVSNAVNSENYEHLGIHIIHPGNSIVLKVETELPLSAGNNLKNRTLNVNVVVDAVQADNQTDPVTW
jgi:hypothetical protein